MIIETRDLQKRFGRHAALRGLDLAVPEGSAYALLGANGAGKTTAIKILMGLIPPSGGDARVLGVDSRRLGPDILQAIGYVSENQQFPKRLQVGEYLAYLKPFYTRWDDALATAIRSQLYLPLDRRIGELSHGMRIKMALIAALSFRPQLLVLDEPFSGLDPLVRDEFMEGLLRQAGELTILISSHELGEIEGLTTHVGFIDDGRTLFQESSEALQARVREVRVTVPGEATLPASWPTEWLQPQASGSVIGFVDTRYSGTVLGERLRAVLGPITHIDAQPMSLRTTFTVLARAARGGHAVSARSIQ